MNEQIFISYSRDDRKTVFAIKDEIESRIGSGKCWVDLDGIESDKQFVDVIIRAILDCDIFLFMYSKNSEKSEWTKKEIDFAKSENKKIVFINIDGFQLTPYYKFLYGGHEIIDIKDGSQKEKFLNNITDWCGGNTIKTNTTTVQPPARPKDFTLYLLLSSFLSIPMALGWITISGEQHVNLPLATFATIIGIIISVIITFCALTMTHKWDLRSRFCNVMFLMSLNFLVLYVVISFGLSFSRMDILRLNMPSTIISLLAIVALFLLFNHKKSGYFLLCASAIIMSCSSYFWLVRSITGVIILLVLSFIILSIFTFVLQQKWKGKSVWEQLD